MIREPRQLALGVRLRDVATFEAFEPGPNGAALAWLARVVGALHSVAEPVGETADVCSGNRPGGRGPGERGWLWGPEGSGRSHLLEAACHAAVGHGLRVIYLTPDLITAAPDTVLAGLEHCQLVALDDLGRLAGDREAELALFDLCNRLTDAGALLLAAAGAAPLSHSWCLPDLASRLAAATVFRLRPLDDAGRARALQRRAEIRGLELPGRTARFILSRVDRQPGALFALLDELDLASLAAQRRLTVPFVRDLLAQRNPP